MLELRILIGFQSEGDMIKMMLLEELKGFESRLGKRASDKGEVKYVPHVISYQHKRRALWCY